MDLNLDKLSIWMDDVLYSRLLFSPRIGSSGYTYAGPTNTRMQCNADHLTEHTSVARIFHLHHQSENSRTFFSHTSSAVYFHSLAQEVRVLRYVPSFSGQTGPWFGVRERFCLNNRAII
jgi:hypothetical protein